MKVAQQERSAQQAESRGLVYWISLAEAERRFEATHEQLVTAVRGGRLHTRRILVDSDLVVAASSRELDEVFGRRVAKREQAPRTEVALADVALRVELEAERVQRARLEGELATANKIERSLQRYADRLEVELDQARKQAMTLARALGRAEQLAAGAQKQLAAAPRSAWWKFWR